MGGHILNDGRRTRHWPLSAMGLRLRLFGLLVAAKLLVCMCGLTPVRVQSPLVELISPSPASHVRVDSSRFEMVRAYVDDGITDFVFEGFPDILCDGTGTTITADVEMTFRTIYRKGMQIYTVASSGITALSNPPGSEQIHLVGRYPEEAESMIILSIKNNEMEGSFTRCNTTWNLVPRYQDADGTVHEIVDQRATSNASVTGQLSIDDEPEAGDSDVELLSTSTQATSTTVYAGDSNVINMFIECDKGCTEQHTAEYIAAVVNGISAIMERDLGRTVVIGRLRFWSDADPFSVKKWSEYTDSDRPTSLRPQLLELRSWYSQNMHSETYDTAHLFTDHQLGGLAWKGTTCQQNGLYNFGVDGLNGQWQLQHTTSDYNWDVIVVAHELGHGLNSPHTHQYDPPLDNCVSCDSAGTCSFASSGSAQCGVGTLMSYCHVCGGSGNVELRLHPTVQGVMRTYLDEHCGALQPTAAPSVVPTAAPTMHTVTISQTVRLETLSTSSFSENAFIDSINLHAASACTRAGIISQNESVSTSISAEADLQSSSGSAPATGSGSSVSLMQTFGHRDNVVPEIAAVQIGLSAPSSGNSSDLSVTYTTTVQTANNPTSNQLSSIGTEMDSQVMSSVCSDMSSYCSNHSDESPCVGCSNSSVTSASDVSSNTISAFVLASTSDSSSGISTGLIVALGVGVCLLIALIILLIYCCCFKNATTSDSQDTPGEDKAALLKGEQKKGEGTGEEIKSPKSPRPEHVGAEVASDGVSSDVHEQHMETKQTLEDCGLVFETHGEITIEGTVATVEDKPKVQEESNEDNLTIYTVEGTIEDSVGIPEEQL